MRGCTSKSPCDISGKMPQCWHHTFPEKSTAAVRGCKDGKGGEPIVSCHHPTCCRPDAGTERAARGVDGHAESPKAIPAGSAWGPPRWGEGLPRRGSNPSPQRLSVQPPGRDLCSAAQREEGNGARGSLLPAPQLPRARG